jgi:hypothetical protein
VDEWQMNSDEAADIEIEQHITFGDRLDAARSCADELGLAIPTLVDGMDNTACETSSAWPEHVYIADEGGNRGSHGPYDFRPSEARASLVQLLGS